jgi:cytochrome P450
MFIINCLLAGIALATSIVLWNVCTLLWYYRQAKATGLPTYVQGIANGAPLWMMASPIVMSVAEQLPFTESFQQKYRRGWEARVKCKPHVTLGDIFIIGKSANLRYGQRGVTRTHFSKVAQELCSYPKLVTPRGNWVKIGNHKIAYELAKRRDEFGRDMEAFKVLDIYGKSISTAEGDDWNRHRKVSAATFTEKNNELVWEESLRQATEMLEFWLNRSPQPIRTIGEDIKTFTLNVLSGALFGKRYPFEGRSESSQKEKNGSTHAGFLYRNSTSTILEQIVPILVFGEKVLREAWWLPESFHKAGHAVADFRTHVNDLINEEEALEDLKDEKPSGRTLVGNLVRASRAGTKPLTRDEVTSNLFVFAFAGNDTTAITLTHILGFLAAHPEAQEWIAEEIRHYSEPGADGIALPYETCAKLKRCWAVMVS